MIAALFLSLVLVQSTPSPTASTPMVKRMPLTLPTTSATAVITNSGSTNFEGYRIAVEPSGAASWILGGALHSGKLKPETAKDFFGQLAAAGKLDRLPVEHCMKSASFGTTTRIYWHGASSQDIGCGATGSVAAKLMESVNAIVAELNVKPGPAGKRYPL